MGAAESSSRRRALHNNSPRTSAPSSSPPSSQTSNNADTTTPLATALTRPQVRCWSCNDVFHSTLAGVHAHQVRCPYCSTVNGVPAVDDTSSPSGPASLQRAVVAARAARRLQQQQQQSVVAVERAVVAALSTLPITTRRQQQVLRRLQARDISPIELLILRDFVEHLQDARAESNAGASTSDVERLTAEWVVDDVSKLPDELRSCCVCLDEVCTSQRVRTLPCLHTFHAECVEEWLSKKKVCPLCQFSIDAAGPVDDD